MPEELTILAVTAASIGFFHTVLGPDHYFPFIVMARAGNWSAAKTAWVTALCGLGHVVGSVFLGVVGIALGVAVSRLGAVESVRGSLAAWGLIAFGLAYFVWGMRRAGRNTPHTHLHTHADGTVHAHEHVHGEEHVHARNCPGVNPRNESRSGETFPNDGRVPVPCMV